MSQCDVDQAVFFRVEKNSLIAMGVHVDDLTVITSGIELMDEVKTNLRKDFEITDEGPIHWILGFAVERNREARTLSLSQVSYIDSIIRRFNLEDAKPVTTPMEPAVHLSATQSPQTAAEAAEMRDIINVNGYWVTWVSSVLSRRWCAFIPPFSSLIGFGC